MTSLSPVSINNYFSSGQAAVTHWTADDKFSCWVDKITGISVDHVFGDYLFDDFFNHCFPDFIIGCIFFVLSGNNNRIHPARCAVVIFNGYLGFSVRP